jgi:hypothetical protein
MARFAPPNRELIGWDSALLLKNSAVRAPDFTSGNNRLFDTIIRSYEKAATECDIF